MRLARSRLLTGNTALHSRNARWGAGGRRLQPEGGRGAASQFHQNPSADATASAESPSLCRWHSGTEGAWGTAVFFRGDLGGLFVQRTALRAREFVAGQGTGVSRCRHLAVVSLRRFRLRRLAGLAAVGRTGLAATWIAGRFAAIGDAAARWPSPRGAGPKVRGEPAGGPQKGQSGHQRTEPRASRHRTSLLGEKDQGYTVGDCSRLTACYCHGFPASSMRQSPRSSRTVTHMLVIR